MDKLYYQEYYFLERNHWWFKVREDILKDCLAINIPNNNSPGTGPLFSDNTENNSPLRGAPDSEYSNNQLKILNIGAATGKTSEMLRNFGEVISIEYDKDCCEFVENKLNIKVIFKWFNTWFTF